MESENSTQLKVGIFLSLGIIIVLVSIFMLGGDKAVFKSYLRVHAQFEQVQGLAKGSVVSFSGITVGNIEKIDYDVKLNLVDVTMKIDDSFANLIAKNSQVEIRTQGALGDKFIFIIPGDMKTGTLENGVKLEVAHATDLLGIISERGQETNKIFDIINEMYKLTKQINAENRVDKIMTNITTASQNMSTASIEVKKIVSDINSQNNTQKIQSSIEKLNSILAKIDNGQGTLGALINDPTIHNQLKGFLGSSGRKNSLKYLMRTSIEKEND